MKTNCELCGSYLPPDNVLILECYIYGCSFPEEKEVCTECYNNQEINHSHPLKGCQLDDPYEIDKEEDPFNK